MALLDFCSDVAVVPRRSWGCGSSMLVRKCHQVFNGGWQMGVKDAVCRRCSEVCMRVASCS